MRPRDLSEFVGQEEVVGKGTLLYRAILADRLQSLILCGPPGTGKTTLASVIANTTKAEFVRLNATTSGVKDIKVVVDNAKAALGMTGRRTILFVDEIHRFNKAQQDVLLPHVEEGILILIGATTENPYFEVNKALVSRSTVFRLAPLTNDHVKTLLTRAITDADRGLGALDIGIEQNALDFLANIASGDARAGLNALELAALTTPPDAHGRINIDLDVAQECVQRRSLNYEKDGDNHFDTVSAFIKSMRGSDPDAALYYLARMIYAGESPRFVARRMVICASEDVGNADPHALLVAVAAAQAVDFIGFPEAQIILAQAVTYIACAPKSNAAVASISAAMEDVKNVAISGIPIHLRDAHYKDAAKLGHGVDYKYSHAYPGSYVPQQYLPDELKGRIYYEPSDNGVEKRIKENLDKLRAKD